MQSHEGTYCARSSPRVDPIYQHIGTWKQAGTCQVSKSISSSPFFHPRPQFSRFKARTWLHSFELKRVEKESTLWIIKWIPLTRKHPKKVANAFPGRLVTMSRSMSVVVSPYCYKQMYQRREGVGVLYLWFSSHLLSGRHQQRDS